MRQFHPHIVMMDVGRLSYRKIPFLKEAQKLEPRPIVLEPATKPCRLTSLARPVFEAALHRAFETQELSAA